MRTRSALALLALLATGCAVFPGWGGRGARAGLREKPVASKEPPTSLIAVDGTRCLVTEEKYRNTAIGESVWCYWTVDGESRRGASNPSAARTSTAAGSGTVTPVRTPPSLGMGRIRQR